MKTANFFTNEKVHYSIVYNEKTTEIVEIHKCFPASVDEFLDDMALIASHQGEDSLNPIALKLVKDNYGKEFFRKFKGFVKSLKH